MKKILFCLASIAVLFLSSCSKDMLDTTPTSDISGTDMLKSATNAKVALNGIYRALYTPNDDWLATTDNVQQNFGIVSSNLVADLMGEDFVQHEMGSGWFYFDYKYDVHSRYASRAWRCYGLWNFYYKIISNANYIIGAEKTMEGSEAEVKSVVGQALALRAYAYYYLTLFFQQTYKGNENLPGVPLYTEPTLASSEGKGRGTLQDVYTQIDTDLATAAEYLGKPEAKTAHKSNIDYFVVKAIQAKVFLTEEKFEAAAAAAKEARSKATILSKTSITSTTAPFRFNDVSNSCVIWGGQVIETEAVSGGWGTLFCHMDAGFTADAKKANGYGVRSRKCIDSLLYTKIPATDARLTWWRGSIWPTKNAETGSVCSFVQRKFEYKDATKYTGDYIYIRAEEMLLIEAEALCRQSSPDYAGARTLLKELGDQRDANMSTRLAARTDANTYNTDTHAEPVTLLDEILLQRRIELWGEAGRLFDLKRLKLGFTRSYTNSNHAEKLSSVNTGVASKMFVLPIPQSEFDGNKALDITKDQNPM